MVTGTDSNSGIELYCLECSDGRAVIGYLNLSANMPCRAPLGFYIVKNPRFVSVLPLPIPRPGLTPDIVHLVAILPVTYYNDPSPVDEYAVKKDCVIRYFKVPPDSNLAKLYEQSSGGLKSAITTESLSRPRRVRDQ